MKETEKYISHRLTGSLRYCTTIHRRRQFSQRTFLQIEPIKCLQIIGPNLFTTQAQSSKMPRVGQHSQVWGGFGGVGVEIGFCHWTGLAPHLHLHLQLCSPPIGWPPTHIRNGQSNARNGEAELGAGGCRHPPRRLRGAATRAVRLVPAPSALARPQSEWKWRLCVGWKAQWGWRWSEQWE